MSWLKGKKVLASVGPESIWPETMTVRFIRHQTFRDVFSLRLNFNRYLPPNMLEYQLAPLHESGRI